MGASRIRLFDILAKRERQGRHSARKGAKVTLAVAYFWKRLVASRLMRGRITTSRICKSTVGRERIGWKWISEMLGHGFVNNVKEWCFFYFLTTLKTHFFKLIECEASAYVPSPLDVQEDGEHVGFWGTPLGYRPILRMGHPFGWEGSGRTVHPYTAFSAFHATFYFRKQTPQTLFFNLKLVFLLPTPRCARLIGLLVWRYNSLSVTRPHRPLCLEPIVRFYTSLPSFLQGPLPRAANWDAISNRGPHFRGNEPMRRLFFFFVGLGLVLVGSRHTERGISVAQLCAGYVQKESERRK